MNIDPDPVSKVYSAIGGDAPFYALVEAFYNGVENDTLLRPLYPKDLTEPKRSLALFLIQRTGGPGTYSQERGHPRMRARHMPFRITTAERDAWMRCMEAALDAVPEFAVHRQTMHEFFDNFATFMINTPG
jgi:hemoglobin